MNYSIAYPDGIVSIDGLKRIYSTTADLVDLCTDDWCDGLEWDTLPEATELFETFADIQNKYGATVLFRGCADILAGMLRDAEFAFEKELQKEKKIPPLVGGKSSERLYGVWRGMLTRCYCESHESYKNYGGRGIYVCHQWKDDYMAFRTWAYLNGYDDKAAHGECTIDRIDVNDGYHPKNCRWVSMAVQARNKRNTKRM